jgi:hypothetical protein
MDLSRAGLIGHRRARKTLGEVKNIVACRAEHAAQRRDVPLECVRILAQYLANVDDRAEPGK